MPSYRKQPDRLEEMAARRLLEDLGAARQAVIAAMTQVKPAGPVYHGCQMVTSAIDALAHQVTGSPYYFHAEGSLARQESRIGAGIDRTPSEAEAMRPLRSRPDQLEIRAAAQCRCCGKAGELMLANCSAPRIWMGSRSGRVGFASQIAERPP